MTEGGRNGRHRIDFGFIQQKLVIYQSSQLERILLNFNGHLSRSLTRDNFFSACITTNTPDVSYHCSNETIRPKPIAAIALNASPMYVPKPSIHLSIYPSVCLSRYSSGNNNFGNASKILVASSMAKTPLNSLLGVCSLLYDCRTRWYSNQTRLMRVFLIAQIGSTLSPAS